MKFTPAKPFLLGETLESLGARLSEMREKDFRAKQILEWVYKKFELSPEAMTNLSPKLRGWLKETFNMTPCERVLVKGDPDATQKLLLKQEDGSLIETVLIRAPIFNEENEQFSPECSPRKTVCISTQVGCAYGCKFCASGLAGWRRDLTAGEIIAELFEIIKLGDGQNEWTPPVRKTRGPLGVTSLDIPPPARKSKVMKEGLPFDNIVVMGMGEPLANFDNLMRALTIINAPWGFNFGARRITVSTSGVVPRIRQLAEMPVQFRLAISLHGATNEVRNQIMPVNKKYPLEELMGAVREYNTKHNRMITFEYILIEELNDTYEQAEALIKICEGLKVHINCIPYNRVEGLPWRRPSTMRQQVFVKKLKDAGMSVTIRHEKGNRIEAACGQLRLKEEQKAH